MGKICVAASAFDRLAEGADVEALVDRLVRDYDIDSVVLRRDLEDLLSDLEKYGLIEPVP